MTKEKLNARPLFRDFRYPVYNFNSIEEINLLKNIMVRQIETEFFEEDKKLVFDDNLRKNLNFITGWITGKNIDIKLNKGIQLCGDVGKTKSSILKGIYKTIMFIYDVNAIYTTANHLAHIYRRLSFEEAKAIELNKVLTCRILFIDDVGTEDTKVYDSFPLQEIIRERYDRKRIVCFSTNIVSDKEMIAKYTKSIEDKLNHMTFRLEFTGNSLRDDI